MNAAFQPTTPAELAEAVRAAPRVLAVGAGTKPRLAQVAGDVVKISTAKLRGIVEYEPGEFTFTALAGTPLRDIVAALTEKGQYLPFDPLLVEAGATLGGTVAAGLSGAGRCRFGGLRDFILGVKFADGEGRLLRMGGKVVKNAAGFDLPKFFVGSLGRFGVLAEITFKVFPRPAATRTLRLAFAEPGGLLELLGQAGRSRWEIDALEICARSLTALVRLGGPEAALEPLAGELLARWPGEVLDAAGAAACWRELREATWVEAGQTWLKVPIVPDDVAAVVRHFGRLARGRAWVGGAGSVAWLALAEPAEADALAAFLRETRRGALTLRGDGPLWRGEQPRFEAMRAVKAALDPRNRFPQLDE